MGLIIGDGGAVSIAPESTYGTAGTVFQFMHGITAGLGNRKGLIPKARLGLTPPATRKYEIGYADGDVAVAWDDSRAVCSNLMELFGALSTDTYQIGGDYTPDLFSATIRKDTGGYMKEYVGQRGASLRFEMEPNQPIKCTATFLGRLGTNETPVTITLPTETGIVYANDLGTITVGGTALCIMRATFDVKVPLSGSDRYCLGGSALKSPRIAGGPYEITGTFDTELSDDTGEDSIAVVDVWDAGTAVGDIVIGDFEMTACYATGEDPPLDSGITMFTLGVEGGSLEVTTTA